MFEALVPKASPYINIPCFKCQSGDAISCTWLVSLEAPRDGGGLAMKSTQSYTWRPPQEPLIILCPVSPGELSGNTGLTLVQNSRVRQCRRRGRSEDCPGKTPQGLALQPTHGTDGETERRGPLQVTCWPMAEPGLAPPTGRHGSGWYKPLAKCPEPAL